MSNDAASLASRGMLVDPGDHFKGHFEVERKYRVDDLSCIRVKLEELGAVAFTLGNRERDIFFDHPDRRLECNNQHQSLRAMTPSGRVLWISKGPGPDECIAMDLSDLDKASKMLVSIGFVEVMTLSKDRDIYFLGEDLHVTLDHVAGLGFFVELAGMTDDQAQLGHLGEKVRQAASSLGLGRDQLQDQSYRTMLSNAAIQA